jgi:hypothetical protein
MPITPQNRAIRNYRNRLRKQGVIRFEVLGLESDRDLIRSLTRRLVQNDAEAMQIRQEISHKIAPAGAKKGDILAALRRSPMVGADLDLTRTRETGRKVDL